MAGAFHSIYGTEKFKVKTLPLERRSEAKVFIGERAEELVYLFGLSYRHGLFDLTDAGPYEAHLPSLDRRVQIARATYSSLIEIEAANIVNAALHQAKAPAWAAPWWLGRFEAKSAFLSVDAFESCKRVLGAFPKVKIHTAQSRPRKLLSQSAVCARRSIGMI
jgi:hypothetical protein